MRLSVIIHDLGYQVIRISISPLSPTDFHFDHLPSPPCTQMLLTKFAVVAVLLVSTVLANPEAPVKIRFRMKGGVKRDASHIANYYLPAATTYQQQAQYQYQPQQQHYQHQHQVGGLSGAQHLQVLDVKIPQSQGHYIPSYALPSKSYESNAQHFHGHTPQFTHTGQQYVLSSGHGGSFEELAKALGGQGASSASASGHAAFGGASVSGHGYAASASPSYSYSSQSFGHQQAAQQAAPITAHGGYSFASLPQQTTATETTKTGPISFGEQSAGQIQQQVQHQQQPQIQVQAPSYGGHQFGFVAGSGGHEQQQQAAPQITYLPQAQALTSAGHGASLGQTQSTPVYAVGMKGLGHYATGNYFGHGGQGASSSSLSSHGQGLSLGHSLGGHSFGGHSLGGQSLGALSYGGGSHGQYILDTSALKGLNLGGSKFIIMSKPTAVTYGHHHSFPAQHYPRYTSPTASYSAASLSASAGGYKSSAPFKPSVFLGATQESVSEYQHGNYGQEATASTGYSSGGGDYKFVGPTAATSYATTSGHGH